MSDLKRKESTRSLAAAVLGGKWRLPMLRTILGALGPLRFAEIKAGVPGITARVLTRELRLLEECGVLIRHVLSSSPLRVEYRVTECGKALRPTLAALVEWEKALDR